MAFIPPINTRLPHATPGGIGSALALVVVCQGQLLFRGGLKDAFGRPNANEAAGATLMRIDLQKVDAEIAALRSRLAAINDDLDECRIGYFEHPWAWSQIRRGLTFERHRVQRRLEDFTFARRCAGGRPRGPVVMLWFRSLASTGERNTGGIEHREQAPDWFADAPPSFETIDRPYVGV